MKLTQLLLCKTPFTPSYEHLVTGCSSTEFYNKLASEDSTQTISPVLTPNITFRPVRETDREIVFSVNLIGENALYIKPQDYNYVATYEQYPTSRRFWFIESYNVDNSGVYPTVTFYCSIDYWHSYCLDGNVINQKIVRVTQNGKNISTNQYGMESFVPTHYIINHDYERILWARVRINVSMLKKPGAYYYLPDDIGTIFSGSLPYIYFPIGKTRYFRFSPNNSMSINPSNKQWLISKTADYEFREGEEITTDYTLCPNGELFVNYVGKLPFVESVSLTYLPPFSYTVDNDSITINNCVSVVLCNGFTAGVVSEGDLIGVGACPIYDYSMNPIVYTFENSDIFYDRYPFHYYSIIVGGREITVPYPINSVRFDMFNNGSGDSATCNLYINGTVIETNLPLNMSVPLPINIDKAGEIEALYGTGFREIRGLNSIFSNVSKVANSDTLPELIVNGISGGLSLSTDAYSFNAEHRTISRSYVPTTQADVIAFGDYPYVVEHIPTHDYSRSIKRFIKVFGERVELFDNPIVHNHKLFDYVQTSNATVMSSSLNDKGNTLIANAFNRGVHLWHYDNLNTFVDISNFELDNDDN